MLANLKIIWQFHVHPVTGARGTDHPHFSNFLFTNLFSIKFLHFFIISSLFPYFNLFVSIFIQYYVNIKLHVSTLYSHTGTRIPDPLFPHLVPPSIMVWIFVWRYIFEPFIHILQHFVLQLSRSTNFCLYVYAQGLGASEKKKNKKKYYIILHFFN
jgi:hypothetical protein